MRVGTNALLISNKRDISLDYVVDELRRQQKGFLRVNTEDLPTMTGEVRFPDFKHELTRDGRSWDMLSQFSGIFYRRPGRPFADDCASEDENVVKNYCWEQWAAYLDANLSINDVIWINHPVTSSLMESKIRQLNMAQAMGFSIPRTCVTWTKDIARSFVESCPSGAIAKSLSSTILEYPEKDYFVFTNEVASVDGIDESELAMSPVIFQEKIPDKVDVRVTVVGSDVFAVRIESTDDSEIPLDWRTKKESVGFTPLTLPDLTKSLCQRYVQSAGLVFGAIDLLYAEDRYIFLEINPSGEWGWLQARADLPIARSMVNELFSN